MQVHQSGHYNQKNPFDYLKNKKFKDKEKDDFKKDLSSAILDLKYKNQKLRYIITSIKSDFHNIQNSFNLAQNSIKAINTLEKKIKNSLEIAYQAENVILSDSERFPLHYSLRNIYADIDQERLTFKFMTPSIVNLNSSGKFESVTLIDLGLVENNMWVFDLRKRNACKNTIDILERSEKRITQEKYKINGYCKYLENEIEAIFEKLTQVEKEMNKLGINPPKEILFDFTDNLEYYYKAIPNMYNITSENVYKLLEG